MKRNEVAGYACPVCGTANAIDGNYCSNCGNWMLDTVREPIPLTKKEYRKHTKKQPNPYFRLAFWQAWAIFSMLFELLCKSQWGFDAVLLAYLLFVLRVNIKTGRAIAKLQEKAQTEIPRKENVSAIS